MIPTHPEKTVTTLLKIKDLHLSFQQDEQITPVLQGVSLELTKRQTLCLVGESGVGKSMTALSIMRVLPKGGKIDSGRIWFDGQDLMQLSERELNKLRGNRMAMVYQQPVASLNPIMPIGKQVEEVYEIHTDLPRRERRQRTLDLFELVRIENPLQIAKQYAQQLSGGQAQRVMLAMALACKPKLLIADEPTTALDTSTQAGILELLHDLQQAYGLSILLITHDMAVVKQMADHVAVMHAGKVVEQSTSDAIFSNPAQPYTRDLLRAARVTGPVPRSYSTEPILSAERVSKRHWIKTGVLSRYPIEAVIDVSLNLQVGETLALVGRSGSGKTTLGKAIICLDLPDSGSLHFEGIDLYAVKKKERYPHLRAIQMVFQDPLSAFNPNLPVSTSIIEGLVIHKIGDREERRARLQRVLVEVGLTTEQAKRFPEQLSGGQLQRAALARALIVEPKIVVLDEPVSALDVISRAKIIRLLKQLQQRHKLTLMLISHNMLVVRDMAHRVAVMHEGHIVEVNSSDAIFQNPQHEQTRELLKAVPGNWLASGQGDAVK